MPSRWVSLPAVLLAGVLWSIEAQAVGIKGSDGSSLDLRVLAQTTAQATEDGAPNGSSVGKEFYLRRLRLIASGQLNSTISFFVDTDSPNLGKGGDWSGPMVVQDAWVSFKANKALQLDTGMIIIPLSHQSVQGAVSLHTLDYHAALIRYPKGSTRVFRDMGVQLRGLVADDRIQYRVGVFNGITGKAGEDAAPNPRDLPRVAGMVRLNLLDPEPDFFFSGIYFGKRRVISVGFGMDYQPDAILAGTELHSYRAVAGDLFVDLPIGAHQELIAQTSLHWYDQGPKSSDSGIGYFAEAGYRYRWIEPLVSVERFFSATSGNAYTAARAGLNFWIQEHRANVKTELASEKIGPLATADAHWVGTVQAQLFF